MIWLLSVFWMAPTRSLLVFCFFTSSHCLGGKAKETHHARHGDKLWQVKTTSQKGNDYMTPFPTHLRVTVNVSAPVQLDKPMTVACIANMVIFRSKFLAPLGALIVSPFRDPVPSIHPSIQHIGLIVPICTIWP